MYPFRAAFLAALRDALAVAATGGRSFIPLNRTLTRQLRAWQAMLLHGDPATPTLTRHEPRQCRRFVMDASTSCGMTGVWRDADDLRLWH